MPMIRAEPLGDLLALILQANGQVNAVALLDGEGTILDSREAPSDEDLRTRLYAVVAARAWRPGRQWTGLELESAKLCTIGIGALLLLAVGTPEVAWADLVQLLEAARKPFAQLESTAAA